MLNNSRRTFLTSVVAMMGVGVIATGLNPASLEAQVVPQDAPLNLYNVTLNLEFDRINWHGNGEIHQVSTTMSGLFVDEEAASKWGKAKVPNKYLDGHTEEKAQELISSGFYPTTVKIIGEVPVVLLKNNATKEDLDLVVLARELSKPSAA
jgi:hypothetical protein